MSVKGKLFTTVILTTCTAAVTALINKSISISATAKNLLSSEKSLCYRWRFGNIHYTKSGTGSPILLVHDLEAAGNSYEWNGIVNKLKDNHTVYTIDLLGCGLSEKPNLTYTNYLYVQLISDFIKSIIGHRANIIASGSSSSLAIMACNYNTELFNKIIIINPDSIIKCSQIPNSMTKLYKIFLDMPIIGTLLYNIAYSRKSIADRFAHNYFYNPYSIKPSMLNIYHESAHLGNAPKSIYASIQCNYTRMNIPFALKNINNSIYIIGGSDEPDILNIFNEYHAINSSIESKIIKNSKHFPHIEAIDDFVNAMNLFLDI